jgi:DUF2075 family protein
MICAYHSDFDQFQRDCADGSIALKVGEGYLRHYGHLPGESERDSWSASLPAASKLLTAARLQNADVFVELQMPLSSARCDLLLVGNNHDGNATALVVELKQWSRVSPSAIRDTVSVLGRPQMHPSVQVRSYVNHLRHCHGAFTESGLTSCGCAYLHNASTADSLRVLTSTSAFDTAPREFPVFMADDGERFAEFITGRVGHGKVSNARGLILGARIMPSTKLLDHVDRAVQGIHEWRLLDEQLLAFNQVVSTVDSAKQGGTASRHLIVIRGGPGSGKSVLAIQLLAYGARHQWRVAHATGSKAFQTVLQAKTKHFAAQLLKKIHSAQFKSDVPVQELFTTFRDIARLGTIGQQLDVVIGDEGHRLWDFRRNVRTYQVESAVPMIEEMLAASAVTVIFLDDNQGVRANEIGSVSYLQEHAARLGCGFTLVDLYIQFRCGGSTSYLHWVENRLGFPAPCSTAWESDRAYDFRIYSDMTEMRKQLMEFSTGDDRCRIVAGFCWRWSKPLRDGSLLADVSDSRFGGWSGPWIEKSDRYAEATQHRYFRWATQESCFDQVGSIYSIQGFEFDYVGVIFGDDFVIRDGRWQANLKRNKDSQFKEDMRRRRRLGHVVDETAQLRNIYRVLLTRGMKGTFVFFLDEETRKHFEGGLLPAPGTVG